MRKRWLFIPIVVLLVALGVVGGAVLAEQVSDGDKVRDDGDKKGFAGRVAEILGLDEETVADAMKQAKKEMHEEYVQAWLDKMVESGRITQEQADEYQNWLDDRPEGFEKSWGKGFGRDGLRGKGRWGKGCCGKDSDSNPSESGTESGST